MTTTKHLSQCFIKIGGRDVSADFMHDLAEVVVDQSLQLPDMFTILLYDPQLRWVDDARLSIGNEVEIQIQTGAEEGGAGLSIRGRLIKGEITSLEPEFSWEGQSTLLVRGYDRSHRLHRGKKTRTFTNQTDAQIVQKIAQEVGLSPEVDTESTNITYAWVLQNNQTNMEFLMTRAERIGYQVYAADGKLYFKKGDAVLGEGPRLTLGDTLEHFRPRWRATHQADQITVQGWDPVGKEAVTGSATPNRRLNQGGMQQTGGDTAKQAFSAASAVVVNQPVSTTVEAKALAKGLSNDISREFVKAEGSCRGDPRIRAGWTVTIDNVGDRFKGKYFVTSATHIYNADGYQTTFHITGRHPNLVSRLVGPGGIFQEGRGRMLGVTVGIVTNVRGDPEGLGRIKVQYPYLGKEIESDWIRMAPPMAGKERGFFFLPEVNDEVLLAFEHGDVHRPYMIGALWNKKDKPPLSPDDAIGSDGKVKQRIIRSTSGHIILLEDTPNAQKIVINSQGGHVVTLDDTQNRGNITLQSAAGHTVVLDDKPGGEQILVKDKSGQNKIVINSVQNAITVESQGDISIKAKTANVNIEAMANMSLKSTGQMSLQATGPLSIKSSAVVQIQGSLVKIN